MTTLDYINGSRLVITRDGTKVTAVGQQFADTTPVALDYINGSRLVITRDGRKVVSIDYAAPA